MQLLRPFPSPAPKHGSADTNKAEPPQNAAAPPGNQENNGKAYSFTPPTATPAMMNFERHRYTMITGRMDRQIIM